MARGGKRRGAGRKPTGKAKIITMVRLAPDIHARLKREADQTGQSLTAVIEYYVAYASKALTPADKPTRALCYLIERMAVYARGFGRSSTADASAAIDHNIGEVEFATHHQFNWRASRFDFEAFKIAVTQLLDRWAPKGESGSSPYPDPGYATPDNVARMLVALVNIDEGVLRDHGDVAQKPTGSLYYGQAQALHDLQMGESK
jgi:hypothetical protein